LRRVTECRRQPPKRPPQSELLRPARTHCATLRHRATIKHRACGCGIKCRPWPAHASLVWASRAPGVRSSGVRPMKPSLGTREATLKQMGGKSPANTRRQHLMAFATGGQLCAYITLSLLWQLSWSGSA
jgi:hypothetical protein